MTILSPQSPDPHPVMLVTGAAGLLGRELVAQAVAAGRAVRGVDLLESPHLPPGSAVRGDLRDARVCDEACRGAAVIIHTAARQHHCGVPRWGRRRFFAANVDMTRQLLAAAGRSGAARHFILVSSDMVYGVPQGRPFRESDEPVPIGPYGESKLACERLCEQARGTGLTVTVLRPRLIIGPGRLGVLQKLFERIRTHRPVPILGSGEHRYQMVAVADVAAACLCAVERPHDATYNLGSSDPPSVRALLTEVCRRAQSRSRLQPLPFGLAKMALGLLHAVRMAPLNPEQYRIAGVDYVLDTTRAQAELGWQPRHSDTDMTWSAYQTYLQTLAEHGRAAAPPEEKQAVGIAH